MTDMMHVFDEMLEQVAAAREHIPEKDVTLFRGVKGTKYQGALLVVGRAVNGWTNRYAVASLADPACRAAAIRDAFGESDRCPLSWVAEMWHEQRSCSGTREYNTARSAYWRVIRAVSHSFWTPEPEPRDWSSYFAWTNLYKISPPERGNPSPRLARRQMSAAAAVLSLEIVAFSPCRILFLTGEDWASPFLNELGYQRRDGSSGSYVQSCGSVHLRDEHVSVCVARHPQGKPEGLVVSEIVAAFHNMKLTAAATGA